MDEFILDDNISIHAPTRGATMELDVVESLFRNFNPRSYKRSDVYERVFSHPTTYFNPRSYKRSDQERVQVGTREVVFQSTLLQEERRSVRKGAAE